MAKTISGRVEVGDWASAIGTPFGPPGTVTVGTVSAKYRNIGLGAYDFLAEPTLRSTLATAVAPCLLH